MDRQIDNTDARLLDALQKGIPLTERPFAVIADGLGVSEDEVIARIAKLREDRIIRQISAIFDSQSLGYTGALVAFAVREDRLDGVAASVAALDSVSHCYSRSHRFNLWFTATVPPGRTVADEIEPLTRLEGVEDHLLLPALRVFKVGVFLQMAEGEQSHSVAAARERRVLDLTPEDRAAVRALQKDLAAVSRPFDPLAEEAGMSVDALLDHGHRFMEQGAMRRFAAVLRHTHAGYTANGMVCWLVSPENIERIGSALASHPAVSHCYYRPVYPQWPYSLYTMIHGRSKAELDSLVEELVQLAEGAGYMMLNSQKEYKKSRVVYFA